MDAKNAKVVILCGGRGVRFHEETTNRPKPLVEIGGRPILWHIMKIYSYYGYQDFVLCLGYKGDMIKDYFLNYPTLSSDFTVNLGGENKTVIHNPCPENGWKITMVETGLEAMTGARIKRIEKYIDTDLFMLTYGDAVSDVNIGELIGFHRNHKKIGTVTAVHPLSRFGELRLQKDGTVEEFKEKAVIRNDYINGGFFVFNRKLFDYVEDEDSCIFERKPLEKLSKDRQLTAYVHKGYWQCMDTYRDWQMLDEEWIKGKAPWKVW